MKPVTEHDIEEARRLEQRVSVNNEAIRRCRDRITTYESKIARLRCPYEVGDLIEYREERGIVSRIELFCGDGHVWFRPLKKGGSPGKKETRAWNQSEIVLVGESDAKNA